MTAVTVAARNGTGLACSAMSEHDPEDRAVTAALRRLGLAHHARRVDAARRAAALEHLHAAEALLAEGESRLRWYEVDDTDRGATRRRNRELSAWSGSVNSVAPPVRIEEVTAPDGRRELVGRVRIDRTREGPPRSVHGGVLAGMFDELLGGAQRLGGSLGGVTARLTVRFRRPTPIDEDLELRAWIAEERSRRLVVKAACRVVGADGAASGPVTAEAEGVFLKVDFAGMEAAMRERPAGTASEPAPATETGPSETGP